MLRPTNFVRNSSSSPDEEGVGSPSEAFEYESSSSTVSHLTIQGKQNDLVRDLDLSKSKAELLTSTIKVTTI